MPRQHQAHHGWFEEACDESCRRDNTGVRSSSDGDETEEGKVAQFEKGELFFGGLLLSSQDLGFKGLSCTVTSS